MNRMEQRYRLKYMRSVFFFFSLLAIFNWLFTYIHKQCVCVHPNVPLGIQSSAFHMQNNHFIIGPQLHPTQKGNSDENKIDFN